MTTPEQCALALRGCIASVRLLALTFGAVCGHTDGRNPFSGLPYRKRRQHHSLAGVRQGYGGQGRAPAYPETGQCPRVVHKRESAEKAPEYRGKSRGANAYGTVRDRAGTQVDRTIGSRPRSLQRTVEHCARKLHANQVKRSPWTTKPAGNRSDHVIHHCAQVLTVHTRRAGSLLSALAGAQAPEALELRDGTRISWKSSRRATAGMEVTRAVERVFWDGGVRGEETLWFRQLRSGSLPGPFVLRPIRPSCSRFRCLYRRALCSFRLYVPFCARRL